MSEATRRPGGLTAICIIAIALGGIGSCCSLWNLASVAMQDRLQAMNQRLEQTTPSSAARREQEQMREEIEAYGKTTMPITASFAFVGLLLSIVLLAGGALALNLKAGGRTLLLVAAGVVPPFEIGRTVVEAIFSMHIQSIVERYMTRIMELTALEHGSAAAPPAGMIGTAMGVGSTITLALLAAWVLAKVVYLGVSFFYLRKPEIRALYG